MIQKTPLQWQNCLADVLTFKHAVTISAYLKDVIEPSLRALEIRIAELEGGLEPWADFAKADRELVLRETKKAFALSIQSIWERQLRSYLKQCAKGLDLEEAKIEKANWGGLCSIFQELRKVKMDSFPCYETLHILHLLGNACRHGDGTSASALWNKCPDLWPSRGPSFPLRLELGQPAISSTLSYPQVDDMDVSIERLRDFVCSTALFWQNVKDRYEESISA